MEFIADQGRMAASDPEDEGRWAAVSEVLVAEALERVVSMAEGFTVAASTAAWGSTVAAASMAAKVSKE